MFKVLLVCVLGVFVLYFCLRDDVLFVVDMVNVMFIVMVDFKIMVWMKVVWLLVNFSDFLVINM